MAKRQITQLIDDLDGTVLEHGDGETVYFALDGKTYEIDLSEENAEKLRDVFAPYIGAARPATTFSGTRSARSRSASSGGGKRNDLAQVRAWARENGHSVNERGRISASILEAYDAANA